MAPLPVNPDQASNFTSGLTSILSSLVPLFAFVYIGAIFWTLDYARRRQNPLEKTVPHSLHHYAPAVYAFVVITSLVLIAISSWILLQYSLRQNYPDSEAQVAMQLVLFTACWSTVTAATFTILFVHPAWSRHPIISVGTQSIWILMTWTFWVASAAVIDTAIPLTQLFNKGACQHLVYCGHIQAIFSESIMHLFHDTQFIQSSLLGR
ncbi:hypothetical protein C8R43DRAFT_890771 [Mycena crocata]|nr:hypothetical protein C8R43DRAFT_890771 [Mycena crocata]